MATPYAALSDHPYQKDETMSGTIAVKEQPFSSDALQCAKQWRELTSQQRDWCKAYCSNGGDTLAATPSAYHCASARTAACFNYEIRRNKNVIAFLELYEVLANGTSSREQQIAGLLETIREAPAYEKVLARRLLADIGRRNQRRQRRGRSQTCKSFAAEGRGTPSAEIYSPPVGDAAGRQGSSSQRPRPGN